MRGRGVVCGVVGIAAVAGCTSSSPPVPSGRVVPVAGVIPSFVRAVDGIEVRDVAGVPYPQPFLGGWNVPRPQLVDVDRDGDLDLFVQEVTGRLTFFERVGAAKAPEYSWRTDRFRDLQVGEWYRFADMDGDGDVDLLTEERFSYIRYYRNDGRPGAPDFVLAADTLRDATGAPLFSDRQNIPNLTDIDCNGRLDLFIGRLTGTVSRYEVAATDLAGVPRFGLVTERFEDIEIVAQFGSLHGANTLTFADVDLDGDQDLFWGDFFEPGLLLIENTGADCSAPVLRGQPLPFPLDDPLTTSGYNAPSFGDVDGDGDMDLLIGVIGGAFNPNQTTVENLHLYEQVRPGSFELRTTRFVRTIDIGSESIPALADLDGDGDLDLLLSNKIEPGQSRTGRMYHFENRGTPERAAFQLQGIIELPPAFHYAPALADLDADGDLDMLLGTWRKELQLLHNEGGAFTVVDSAVVTLTRGSNTAPALGDIDSDGDLDLFVGEASGTINFYRNAGTAAAPAFELMSDEYLDIDVGRRSFPVLVDIDRDDDLDLIIGREEGDLLLYRNDGTSQTARFVLDRDFTLAFNAFSTPVFVDIDADGRWEVLAGGIGGGLLLWEERD